MVGQRLIQTVGDILPGWQRVSGVDGRERDFYLCQLRDWKGAVEVEEMVPAGTRICAELCGWTLARAHARTGDRIAIAAYLGSSQAFADAVADFAEVYADRNERDYAALLAAIADGRVTADSGVQERRRCVESQQCRRAVRTRPACQLSLAPTAWSITQRGGRAAPLPRRR